MTCRALGSVGYPDAPSGGATDPSDHDSGLLARHVYPLLIVASTRTTMDLASKGEEGQISTRALISTFEVESRLLP